MTANTANTANTIIHLIENLEQTTKNKNSKEYAITIQAIAYLGIGFHKFLIDRYVNHLSLAAIARKYNTPVSNIKYYSAIWRQKVADIIKTMKDNSISFDIGISAWHIELNRKREQISLFLISFYNK